MTTLEPSLSCLLFATNALNGGDVYAAVCTQSTLRRFTLETILPRDLMLRQHKEGQTVKLLRRNMKGQFSRLRHGVPDIT